MLIALVRDGAYYLDVFLEHYRRLGVSGFVFVDNGSSDGTLARLRQEPDVAVWQAKLPWLAYENDLRAFAAGRYGAGRWCLFADLDELFEFDGAKDLPSLIRQLEAEGHTAMMAQMLEMFPRGPLAEASGLSYRDAVAAFRYADISAVRRLPYTSEASGFAYFLRQNQLPPAAPDLLFGGVRGKVFGENCCLSKHPLVFNAPDVQAAVHPHASAGVQVSDRVALIRHYKFAGESLARDLRTRAEAVSEHGEDRVRIAAMQTQPELSLWSEAALENADIAELQRRGFLQGPGAAAAASLAGRALS
ncbi:glycosyltransferase family 2 protein [Cribrihabitans neustonicus]|uniref:glycosyltransferase family 2 protein n=1 Tax=Cribrihabitans neustonicus TaxID=1429085 RepID=UPI003B5C7509